MSHKHPGCKNSVYFYEGVYESLQGSVAAIRRHGLDISDVFHVEQFGAMLHDYRRALSDLQTQTEMSAMWKKLASNNAKATIASLARERSAVSLLQEIRDCCGPAIGYDMCNKISALLERRQCFLIPNPIGGESDDGKNDH